MNYQIDKMLDDFERLERKIREGEIVDKFYSYVESQLALELQIRSNIEFIRQHPIGKYFADFYFPKMNLVLEVDGRIGHEEPEQLEHDRVRDKVMNGLGYTIIRATGSLVKKTPSGVIDILRLFPRNAKTYFLNSEDDIKYVQQLSIGIIPKSKLKN